MTTASAVYEFAAGNEAGPLGPVVGTAGVVVIGIGIVIYWVRRFQRSSQTPQALIARPPAVRQGDTPAPHAASVRPKVATVPGNVITGVVVAVVVSVAGAAFFGWYGFTASGRRRLIRTRPPARILTPSQEGVRAQRRMWILVCQGLCLLLVFTAVGTVVFALTGNI